MRAVRAGAAMVLLVLTVASCDTEPPAGIGVGVRINAGGDLIADGTIEVEVGIDGQQGDLPTTEEWDDPPPGEWDDEAEPGWQADTVAAPSTHLTSADPSTSSTATPIDLTHGSMPAHVPAELFQSQRVDAVGGDVLRYDVDVPAGTVVQVRLFFAEIEHTDAGQRAFDIFVDDQLMWDEFDIVARAGGPNRGIVLWRSVTSDGSVSVSFGHGAAGDPTLAGLQIVEAVQPVPVIEVTPRHLELTVGQPETVTITNQALEAATLELQQPGLSPFVIQGPTTLMLGPGESTTFTILATSNVVSSATLLVQSNDKVNPSVGISLLVRGPVATSTTSSSSTTSLVATP